MKIRIYGEAATKPMCKIYQRRLTNGSKEYMAESNFL